MFRLIPSRRLTALAVASTLALGAAWAMPWSARAATVPGNYHAAVAPSTVAVASTTSFTVTFTNDSPPTSDDLLTHVTITVAQGFIVRSVTAPSGWSASQSGQAVTFSNSGLGALPTQSVTGTISATAPNTAGTYTWTTSAGGLVGGATGTPSNFSNSAPDPTVTVTPPPATHLAFSVQPSSTPAGQAMSPAPSVVALDDAGHVATTYSAPITLTVNTNPTGASPATSGTSLPVQVTPTNGVATFTGVTFSAKGYGYVLGATSGSLTPASSSPFDVTDAVQPCAPNTTCTATAGNSNNTTLNVALGAGSGSPDVLTITVGAPATFGPCKTRQNLGQPSREENHDTARTVRGTLTVALDPSLPHNVASFGLCYQASHSYTTSSGSPSALDPTTGRYYGLLPSCSTTNNVVPCIVSLAVTDTNVVSTLTNDDSYVQVVFNGFSGDPLPNIGLL